MTEPKVSRRGVYYDLTISPYEYRTPYGDVFKFSSEKKLSIYTRDIVKEICKLEKIIARHNLGAFLDDEIIHLLVKAVYRSFYVKTEG